MDDRSSDSLHGPVRISLVLLLMLGSLRLTAQNPIDGHTSRAPVQTDQASRLDSTAEDTATLRDSLLVEEPGTVRRDSGAELFVASCSGCHSVGGGERKGPDLASTVDWPKVDLVSAIKRMEKEAGPLDESKVSNLYSLLSDPNARARLAEAEAAVLARFAAEVEPGSASTGSALYRGTIALENGGPACTSCHSAQGSGATFAVSLDSVVARLGEVPLASAIESASFPVMDAAYGDRPITSQEAAHLVAYLKSIQEKPIRSAGIDIAKPALLIALVCILLVALYYRNRHQNSSAVAGRR